jgi:hypothetical protein
MDTIIALLEDTRRPARCGVQAFSFSIKTRHPHLDRRTDGINAARSSSRATSSQDSRIRGSGGTKSQWLSQSCGIIPIPRPAIAKNAYEYEYEEEE